MFQPEIIHKNHTQVSPWMSLVEKEVKLAPGSMTETYHCITQDAYVGVMAQLEDGRIAIIKQYRPCVETFTWEFVGGTLDASETPLQAAARELAEEAGLHSDELTLAGEYFPDTGRLDLPSFGVFAGKCVSLKDWIPEPGVEVSFVTLAQLKEMIISGQFKHQLHLGVLASIILQGWLEL